MTEEISNIRNVIRLGWHLHPNDVAVDLPLTNDISQHTALLAQSGSGKSFFLGRFIEELLITTKAKIVIFDANGDFSRLDVVSDKSWTDEKRRKWFGENAGLKRDSGKNTFEQYWNKIDIAKINKTNQSKALLSSFSIPDLLRMLGISEKTSPEIVAQLNQTLEDIVEDKIKNAVEEGKDEEVRYTLEEVLNDLIQKRDAAKDTPESKIIFSLEQKMFQRKAELDIWADDLGGNDVATRINYVLEKWRACIHDLPYIKDNKARLILVNLCLERIWEIAIKQWEDYLEAIVQWENQQVKNPDENVDKPEDNRIPLFIVLDEAHNFLSLSADDPWRLAITDKVSRIVAEGRKYGLFLILSTQRPSKVPNSILIECENVCLLRLNSIIERNKARDIWGISRESIDQAAYFKTPGDCLLFGRWVPSVYAMHAAPRRTKEGGASLGKSWQEPMDEELLRSGEEIKNEEWKTNMAQYDKNKND